MKYTTFDTEKEMKGLSKKIIEIFNVEPYSCGLYSKVLKNIVNTFIKLRLDRFLSRIERKPEINIKNFGIIETVSHHYKRRFLYSEDDESLEWILHELIPSYYNLFDSEAYFNGKFSFDDRLEAIKSYYKIDISKSNLISFWINKNYAELTSEVIDKYNKFLSILFTINKTIYISDNPYVFENEISEKEIRTITINKTNKIINIDYLFFHVEANILSELYSILEENGGLIKSLYLLPNRKKEIQNIRQYLKTNDLFKFDLIKTDFMLLKNGKRINNDNDTKLEFIQRIRKNDPVKITMTKEHAYFNFPLIREEKYSSSDIRNKLQETFKKWLYNSQISEWENSWIDIVKDNKSTTIQNLARKIPKEKFNGQNGDSRVSKYDDKELWIQLIYHTEGKSPSGKVNNIEYKYKKITHQTIASRLNQMKPYLKNYLSPEKDDVYNSFKSWTKLFNYFEKNKRDFDATWQDYQKGKKK